MPILRKSAVLAAALIATAGTAACDNDPTGSGDVDNRLVFTRESGSRIDVGNRVFVWCGEYEEGEITVPALHVLAGNPASGGAWWKLTVVEDDVVPGQPLAFPNNFNYGSPKDADIFLYDASTDNEVSTQADDSSGSITFQELDCSEGGEVRFTIDATIGSEFGGGESVDVSGSFTGEVGDNPF